MVVHGAGAAGAAVRIVVDLRTGLWLGDDGGGWNDGITKRTQQLKFTRGGGRQVEAGGTHGGRKFWLGGF